MITNDMKQHFTRSGVLYNPAHILKILPVEKDFKHDCYCVRVVFVNDRHFSLEFKTREEADKFYQDIVSSWYPGNIVAK